MMGLKVERAGRQEEWPSWCVARVVQVTMAIPA
jgi:hypothetical protein